MNNLLMLIHTLKFLKPIQLVYQLWYRVKAKLPIKKQYGVSHTVIKTLKWRDGIFNLETNIGPNTFNFLNITKFFETGIDWNFNTHKKLWIYNLNYFDFLNQASMTKATGLEFIHDYIASYDNLKDGKESYPTSLRIINWVKFIAKHNINDESINCKLKEDGNRLIDNLEYHLLGNHLLENGFALWFAAHLFDEGRYLKISSKILTTQLNEQIFEDGGHFELSPMYHNLVLYRVLDCIQLGELNDNITAKRLVPFLRDKASQMLSWSNQMTFSNGSMPLFNDSTNGINPKPFDVMTYAEKLQVKKLHLPLKNSGYRTFKNKHYELILDVGQVGPSYQPGHAHSDTFNFELIKNGNPIFVDTGISTYEKNAVRQYQRATQSHNTVKIGDKDQTQVWGGFRVAKRAKITHLKEKLNFVEASHDGYLSDGYNHTRSFLWGEKYLILSDEINRSTSNNAKAYFHLHSSVAIPLVEGNTIKLESLGVSIEFESASTIRIEEYQLSAGFNKTKLAYKIVVLFDQTLKTKISL